MGSAETLNQADKIMGDRMRAVYGNSLPVAHQSTSAAPSNEILSSDMLQIGTDDRGRPIGISLPKLLEGRLLVQGVSGAGKSWTLRRLLEQSAKDIQQIVIDPEGEFRTLSDRYGHLYIEADRLDSAALATLARRVREHRLSVVIDMSELDRDEQMQAVASFFVALIDCPRETWNPTLVAVDEAHLFAPFGGFVGGAASIRKEAIGAVVDLMSRGRKRGLAGVLATQRLARLSKSVVSEVQNFLIGMNTLDLDVKRAAETIGWEVRKASDRLPLLPPGDFVAVGPALSRSPAVLRVGPVETLHIGAAPAIVAPPCVDSETARSLLQIDDLVAASDAGAAENDPRQPAGFKAVRSFVRDPHFPLAAKAYEKLASLAPNGAAIENLAEVLGVALEELAEALALLDGYAVIQTEGVGRVQAVRIARDMSPRAPI